MSTYSSILLGKSPARYYSFEATSGTTEVEKVAGTPATIYNASPTLGVTGKVALAVQTNGTSSYVRVGTGGSFGAGFSWCLWFKHTAASGVAGQIWRDNTSTGGFLVFYGTGGAITVRVAGTDHVVSLPGGFNIFDGNFHFYGCKFTATQVKFFIDGALVDTWSQTISTIPASFFYFGKNGVNAQFNAGVFDEFAYWNAVLADSDFTDIYSAAVAPGVPTSVASVSPTSTTLTLQWSAPSTGGTVDNYETRIDGGTASANTSPHTFTGLTPATSHTLEVRAVGPAGASSWVSVSDTTPGVPNVPTSVSVVAHHTTLVLSWSPPSTGPSPTSYETRIDGGSASTSSSPHTFGGLTPGTSHTVSVRSVAAGGSSSWVDLAADTLAPTEAGYYRAVITLGDIVPGHSWDITTRDEPAYGPTLPLSLGWDIPDGIDYFPAQADLTTLSFGVICSDASELADVVKGSQVTFRMYVDDDPDAEPWQTFDGVVTQLDGEDITSLTDPDLRDFRVTVYAADNNARLASMYVGYTDDWPIESIFDRVTRIADEAGLLLDVGFNGGPHGTGMAGFLAARTHGAAISVLDALKASLKDAADDYDSEPPAEYYGRYAFRYVPDDGTIYVDVFRRRVFSTTTLDGAKTKAEGKWTKSPGPQASDWVIVDGTTFGTPGDTVPLVRNTSLVDYFGGPGGINYSAFERDSLGESLLPDGSTSLNGWAVRALIYAAYLDPDPVALWASWAPPVIPVPVVVTPIAPELEVNAVDYVAGTLVGARLTIRPGGRYDVTFRLRAELLPGSDLP